MVFAKFKEVANTGDFELHLPLGTNVGKAITEICLKYPSLNLEDANFLIAVNYDYADYDKVLKDGDEIALIPPVSGGGA